VAGTFIVDDHGQRALFRHYEPKEIDRIFRASAKAGATSGAKVLQAAAPVGDSQPLSGLYRKYSLRHGALKASVKARPIRKRGVNKTTIGYVMGPGGRGGLARHWVTGGTRPHRVGNRRHPGSRGNPWVDRAASKANDAAAKASDAVITRYLSRIPGG
jgi:hypothetical protein